MAVLHTTIKEELFYVDLKQKKLSKSNLTNVTNETEKNMGMWSLLHDIYVDTAINYTLGNS